jgi:hypothetical protein
MHQHTCPHCQNAAVSNLAVRWSSRETPARCSACSGLCHVVASSSSGIGVFTLVLLAAAGAAGLAMQSFWAGCAAASLAPAYNWWAWRRVELWPIPKDAADTANKVSWIVGLLGLLTFWGQ